VTEYRLLTYNDQGRARPGVLVAQEVYPAAALLGDTAAVADTSSVLSLLEEWETTHRALVRAVRQLGSVPGRPLSEVSLLAPVLYPRAVFCAGANYWDHAEEMARAQGQALDRTQRATDPWFFMKTSAHSIVGTGAPVKLPEKSRRLDWEAELGVVIGRRAHEIPVERAIEVIAGYTIVNDLSARDLMTRPDRPVAMLYDWVGQKCFDGAAPMGPWITPAAFVKDCGNLSIKLWVNDTVKQSSNTRQLIHSVAEQICWLSHQVTLLPGDVIATGTPAGVGMARGEYLERGDQVRIEIECCGELITSIV
jgi:2-keto-4-pentenoate hydratase/2-oxohepta-3-ene-1,7-dioic acid hydratase in catechol pathway